MHRPARLRDLRQSKSSSGSSRCALTSEHELECEQQHLIPFNPAAGVQPRDRKGALHLDRLAAAGKREHAQCANAAAEAAHPAADGAVVRWDRRGVLRLLRIPVRDEVHPHPPHPPPPPRGEAAAGRPPPLPSTRRDNSRKRWDPTEADLATVRAHRQQTRAWQETMEPGEVRDLLEQRRQVPAPPCALPPSRSGRRAGVAPALAAPATPAARCEGRGVSD